MVFVLRIYTLLLIYLFSGIILWYEQVTQAAMAVLQKAQRLQVDLGPHEEMRQQIAEADAQVATLKKRSAELRADIATRQAAVEAAELSCSQLQEALRTLSDIALRWGAVENRLQEFQQKKRRQTQSMAGGDTSALGNRSIDDLEATQRQNMERKDHLQAQKDRLSNEDANLTKRFYSLKGVLAEREAALSEARNRGSRHTELGVEIARLQGRVTEVGERRGFLAQEREGHARELRDKQMLASNAAAALQQQEEMAQGRVSIVRGDRDAFSKMVDALGSIQQRLKDNNQEQVSHALEQLQSCVHTKEGEMRELQPQIEALSGEISSQEHTRRNVQDNLSLRAAKTELSNLRRQLADMQAEQERRVTGADEAGGGSEGGMGGYDNLEHAERDEVRLQKQQQRLQSERDTLRGKLQILKQQVAELKGKLSSGPYRQIGEKHRRKNIEYETTNLAVQDLESYHGAL